MDQNKQSLFFATAQNKVHLTQGGLNDVKAEYEELVKVKRPYMVDRLAGARAAGDLAENSEYTAAKQELAFVDGRIEELENVINNAVLINEGHGNCQEVGVGCRVTVSTNGSGEHVFHLVGEWEANPVEKKISFDSPLGKSLLGKKQGDKVEIDAPAGKIVYTIIHID